MQSLYASSDDELYQGLARSTSNDDSNMTSRVNTIRELVSIQMTFAKDMHHLHQALENAQQSTVSDEDKQNVISSLPSLSKVASEITKSWLNELDRVGKDKLEEAQIAVTFLPFKDRISEALQRYALTYDANESPNSLVSAYFEAALKELQKVKPNISFLDGELIKPVQWLFRYQQLFEKIQKYTPPGHADHRASTEIIDHFTALTRTVNEKKRWNELRSKAFEKHRDKTPLFERACNAFKVAKFKTTDPDLGRERQALTNLRDCCEKMHTWTKDYFNMKRTCLRADREFLMSIMNACSTCGFLQIVPTNGSRRVSEIRINMREQLQPYVEIVQNTLTYITTETIPDLETKVLNRLINLLHYLDDPERLITIYFKTLHSLDVVLAHIEQATERNKSTIALVEKRDTMQSTISTLYSGLMYQLPKLRATAERILLHSLMYIFTLNRNLSNYHSSCMIAQLQLNEPTTSIPVGTRESLLQIIDEMVTRVNNQPSQHLRVIVPKIFKPPSENMRLGFDLLNGQGCGRRSMHKSSTALEDKSSRNNSFHKMDRRGFPFAHSKSYSSDKDLLGFTMPSPVSRLSPILFHERTVQIQQGPVNNHDSTTPVSRRIRARKLNTVSLSGREQISETQNPHGATHRVTYSFTKQNDDQATMSAGQYVKVLRPFDSAGNSQWYLVEVLPGREQGYVPANRLSSLNS